MEDDEEANFWNLKRKKGSTKRGRNAGTSGKKCNRVTGREKINCSVEEQTMRLHQRVWSSRDLQKVFMPAQES